MTTKMKNPETGEEIDVPGRRVKDHLQNGYEIADGTEVPEGNVEPNSDDEKSAQTDDDGPTKEELYEEAQELDIEGRSSMNKEELEKAVEEAKVGEDRVEAETGSDTGDAPVVKSGTDATSTNADTQVRNDTV